MTPDETELARFVDRTLRSLPPRKAPAELSAQVMAALARQAALPWWRRSFLSWPISARIAFVLVCMVVARSTLSVWSRVAAPVSRPLSWVETTRDWLTFSHSLFDHLGAGLLHGVPTLWVYSTIVALCALYALLGGLGAAAYRTLYVTR